MAVELKDLYWLAGLIEGEGCFVHTVDKKGHARFRIQLRMTDNDIVERVARLWHKNTGFHDEISSVVWKTAVSGSEAVQWMMTLYPLMGIRRQMRIKEIIAEWKAYKPRRSNFLGRVHGR